MHYSQCRTTPSGLLLLLSMACSARMFRHHPSGNAPLIALMRQACSTIARLFLSVNCGRIATCGTDSRQPRPSHGKRRGQYDQSPSCLESSSASVRCHEDSQQGRLCGLAAPRHAITAPMPRICQRPYQPSTLGRISALANRSSQNARLTTESLSNGRACPPGSSASQYSRQ